MTSMAVSFHPTAAADAERGGGMATAGGDCGGGCGGGGDESGEFLKPPA